MNSNTKPARLEITIHILIWVVLISLPLLFSMGAGLNWREILDKPWYLVQLLVFGILFYSNYLYLVNNWLFKGNRVAYFLVNFLLVSSIIALKYGWIMPTYFFDEWQGEIPDRAPPLQLVMFIDFFLNTIPIVFAVAILSSRQVIQVRLQEKEADNNRLQSELNYLKYQLQPHFFFNSLNNIYSLVDLDPVKAKESVHSLSKLMRYLLKSTEAELVSLKGEIEFLEKYIELMQIRLQEHVHVHCNFPKAIPDIQLPPLLFISIVENAFKHGVSATQESPIYFELRLDFGHILFEARNTNFPKGQQDLSGSGIGIENLRKRLVLLYGDQFTYFHGLEKDQFVARLILKTDSISKRERLIV